MWYEREYFPRSRPREAKGGIKAQSKRGSFGTSWWAKRWIQVLESFNIGARLGRGRSYARSGQVLSVDVAQGQVKAKVQGSRPTPYAVTIKIKTLSAAEWKKITQALSSQAVFVAKLLAGEMPQDIEQVFDQVKLSLFPQKLRDLSTECSCPDWSNPCKHIAAVYYLLGEEFDRDPFLLFKLRGLSREELLPALAGSRTKEDTSIPASLELSAEPLPVDSARFWSGAALPENFFGTVEAPSVSAALIRRLGHFPFWRGADQFMDVLAPIYERASRRGLAAFVGQDTGESQLGGAVEER